MRTVIFRVMAPYLTSLMFLFSLFVLLRGHNSPGGGFIGGLIGGNLSDRVGRKAMLIAFTAATPPLLYFYLWAENGSWWVLGLLAIAGAITMAPRSVILAVGVVSILAPQETGLIGLISTIAPTEARPHNA